MTFRLIDRGWDKELGEALNADGSALRIICPFIKEGALTALLGKRKIGAIQVITRYNLVDFLQGVSDTNALRILLGHKAEIRGIKNLHAKVFVFGRHRVIVTSANLTSAALNKNHEFGFVSTEKAVVAKANEYFDRLWIEGKENLYPEKIDAWERKIVGCLATGGRPTLPKGLGDEGVDAGFGEDPTGLVPLVNDATQSFVKFLGQANNRVPLTFGTVDEIHRASCHWALGYPESQRPTGVEDGAIMFIARLTKEPPDIRIFGRAFAMRYVPGRDDATQADILKLGWKKNWPRYIRVHHAEFVAGNMGNGISFYEMMAKLGAKSFASTYRHAAEGVGNTDPRKAYGRKPSVQLSSQAYQWLNSRLENAFSAYGKVPDAELDRAGWPSLPLPAPVLSRAEEVAKVESILRRHAKQGDVAIFYRPIMDVIGLSHRNRNHREKIGAILADVSRRSYKKSGVLLSVLVHRKSPGRTRPGAGFLKLAVELGYKWTDDDKFVDSQTQLVLKAYR